MSRAVTTADDFAVATLLLEQLLVCSQRFDDDNFVLFRELSDLVTNGQQRCALNFDQAFVSVNRVDAVAVQINLVTAFVSDVVQFELLMKTGGHGKQRPCRRGEGAVLCRERNTSDSGGARPDNVQSVHPIIGQ